MSLFGNSRSGARNANGPPEGPLAVGVWRGLVGRDALALMPDDEGAGAGEGTMKRSVDAAPRPASAHRKSLDEAETVTLAGTFGLSTPR